MNNHVYKVLARVLLATSSEPAELKSFFNKLFSKDEISNGSGLMESQHNLKACLDNLQTNIFVADKDLNLIYINEIARATLILIEPEIQKAFELRVDEFFGDSIHRFHQNP
ncbi:MAG TPA: hypothetical protein HPP54_10055 [Nitrospinae bacterium]|jgi:methyl-accepting chemotaxis protein|nr:hypothetical protein [Nitrospinota bacterium]